MKANLRYIILLISMLVMGSFVNDISSNNKTIGNDCNPIFPTEDCIVAATSIIFPDTGIYLSRTSSPINIHIAQQINRRNDTEHRLNTSYFKSGKLINTGVCIHIYHNLKTFRSILSEPTHRLNSLGRLII